MVENEECVEIIDYTNIKDTVFKKI